MPNKLTNLQIDEVSLVGKGAIGEKFTIMKSAGVVDVTPAKQHDTLIQKIMKAVTGILVPEQPEVEKSDTNFNDVITRRELQNNFYDGYWVLEDVVWNILKDDSITDKRSLIATSLNQFVAYVLTSYDGLNVTKSSEAIIKMASIKKSATERLEKSGKKVSTENMKKLQEMQSMITTLNSNLATFLTEVEGNVGADIQKEDDDMKPEDLKKAIEESLQPITTSITALAGRIDVVEKAKETVVKTDDNPAITVDSIKKAVTDAIEPINASVTDLSSRIQKLESQEQPSAKIEGQDVIVVKSEAKWPSFNR